MVLDIIENLYYGAEEKIEELIDSVREHIKSFAQGILLSIFSAIFIYFNSISRFIAIALKNPYTTGLFFPAIIINLIFALAIPLIILFDKKTSVLQKVQELVEKFEILNSISDMIAYVIGYFSIILCVYFLFPKYTYLLGITINNVIIEIVLVVIVMLITLKLD